MMGNPPPNWKVDISFRIANALEHAVIAVDKELNAVHYSRFVAQLAPSVDKEKIVTHLIAQVPLLTWQSFLETQQQYLRLTGIFLQQQAYELVLVRVQDAALIYPIAVDDVQQQMRQEFAYLLSEANKTHNPDEIISKTPQYLELLYRIEQVADTNSPVLLCGEMGSGKELLARMLYNLSSRRTHPFFKLSCSTTSNEILERQLFGVVGYQKGANYKNRKGLLEIASEGTVYLDKIEHLDLKLQAKIARLLKDGSFEPIGSSIPTRTNVRLIFSSRKPLLPLMEQGLFAEDLFYLLQKFPLQIPPLRERKDDIPLLIDYFCKKYAKKLGKKIKSPSTKVVRRLMQYDFPGNVRELENLVERAVLLTQTEKLNLETVLPDLNTVVNENGGVSVFLNFEEMQRKHILDALRKTNWRVSGIGSAAELLQLNPKTLVSKMRKLEIRRSNKQSQD